MNILVGYGAAVLIYNVVSHLLFFRSSEWNSIPSVERDRMGLVFRDDGEFWSVHHYALECYIPLIISSPEHKCSR